MPYHSKAKLVKRYRVLLPVKHRRPAISTNFVVTSPQHQWRDAGSMVPIVSFRNSSSGSEFEYTIYTLEDRPIDLSAIIGMCAGYCARLCTAITARALRLVSSHFVSRKSNDCFAEMPRNPIEKMPTPFSGIRILQDWTLSDTENSRRSFRRMPQIFTHERKVQKEMHNARRLYVEERARQQGHLRDELANLNTLLIDQTIDKETWKRYKKLLEIGYENEKKLTKVKYGFIDRSTQIA